jgi:hypothetical protein
VRPPIISVPTPVTLAKCAEACFAYVSNQRLACKAFSIGREPGGDADVCEFTSTCSGEAELDENSGWDTYVLGSYASECDPLPTSPLKSDACGTCGGNNASCQASLVLVTAKKNVESAPTLGSIIATDKFVYPGMVADPAPSVNCSVFPNALGCAQEFESAQELESATMANGTLQHLDPAKLLKYSTVYVYLRLYGSKGSSHQLLHALGSPDLMFAFGSHFGGNRADFSLAFPSAEELGGLSQIKMWIVGGEHWLSTAQGKLFEGIDLTLTSHGVPKTHQLRLMQPLAIDAELDQLVALEWHLPEVPGGFHLPTSVRRCYQDCSRGANLRMQQLYMRAHRDGISCLCRIRPVEKWGDRRA